MISKVMTAVPVGFYGQQVTVECDINKGLPSFNIVGLGDKAVAESRERVRSAIVNSGFSFPSKRITINLAPASLSKEGSHLDLPIAISILICSGQLPQSSVGSVLIAGELSLDGDVRVINGSLLIAEAAKNNSCHRAILPEDNATQAALIPDINVVGVTTLADTVLYLLGEKTIDFASSDKIVRPCTSQTSIDDIRGQETAKRALMIAAAGHHNLLLTGPPGAGKTMLARTLPGLLPSLSTNEVIETTKIYSLSDNPAESVIVCRPFRAPHHTSSFVALIGGGSKVRPGEVSLAHNGVLFMDEIPEFSRTSLEALRQPLEDNVVHISRASGKFSFPANFMLVATMNPCPCGYYGDDKKACSCSQQMILNYQKRLSGPLIDRIDMVIKVARVNKDDMFSDQKNTPGNAANWQKQISAARKTQMDRQSKSNSALSNKELDEFANITDAAKSMLMEASDRLNLSARGHFKTIRIARTIADLDKRETVDISDIAEALRYRQ